MKASTIVRRIRKELGDCEGNRYESWHILEVMRGTLCSLYAVSKDAYVGPKTITVTGGELVDLSGCCDFVQRVDGVLDGNGNVMKTIKTSFESSKGGYTRAACSSDGLPGEAILAGAEGKHIRLSPPLAPGKTVRLRVWCASAPSFEKLGDDVAVPCDQMEDFIKLVKATLLEVDDDSISGQALGDRLTSRAGQMITAKQRQRQAYKKEG
jgi:hypothetical protein